MKQFLFWTPRISIILFAAFLELFAFDTPIFSVGFLMHSLPSLIVLITLLFAWRWERFGAFFYIFLGLFSLFFFYHDSLTPYLLISLPLFVIGGLFWFSYKFR